jgi:hypothetical protein
MKKLLNKIRSGFKLLTEIMIKIGLYAFMTIIIAVPISLFIIPPIFGFIMFLKILGIIIAIVVAWFLLIILFGYIGGCKWDCEDNCNSGYTNYYTGYSGSGRHSSAAEHNKEIDEAKEFLYDYGEEAFNEAYGEDYDFTYL